MLGVKYLKSGFYRDKFNIIDKSVRSYADIKLHKDSTDEEISESRQKTREILERLIVESGFKEDGEEYINIDREFFDSSGGFDEKKLGDFEKKIVGYYGFQDVNWTFAGITSCYTPAIKRGLKENGVDYLDYLPVELKNKEKAKIESKYKNNDPGKYSLIMYPDGTSSPNYVPEKAKISYEELKDKSGFDWRAEYSPDNRIKKKGWTAGFNKNGEWEKLILGESSSNSRQSGSISSKIIFSENSDNINNDISFLVIPENDSIILFDEEGKLIDGEEEKFYSVSGELYGIKEVDINRSIESIKDSFKKQEIKKIDSFVLKDKNEKTLEYYKNKFGDFINKGTKFYVRGDKKLKEKLTTLKNDIEDKEISDSIVSGFYSLTEKGLKGEELYEGLMPSIVKSEYEIGLNIFDKKDDLDEFVTLPEIKEELDDEVKEYLYSIKVPEERKEQFSNAVQNILHNYNNVFKHSNIDKKKLLKNTYDIIVNNKTKTINNMKIVGEKNLYDFIKDNSKISKKTDIPSFKKITKKSKDYYDLSNKEGFDKWSKKELKKQKLSDEAIKNVKTKLMNINIPEASRSLFNRTIQNSFDHFKEIAVNTGMKPDELVDVVNDIVVKDIGEEQYKSKSIYFENDLVTLIKEAEVSNPNKRTVVKEDIYLAKKGEMVDRHLNLLNDNDLNIFAMSNYMENNGISKEDATEIIEYIKKVRVPALRSSSFTRNVLDVLKMNKSHLTSMKIKPVKAIESVTHAIKGDFNKVPQEIKKIIKRSPTRFERKNIISQNNLNNFIKSEDFKKIGITPDQLSKIKDAFTSSPKVDNILDTNASSKEIDKFVKSPEFKKTGIKEDQFSLLINQFKKYNNDKTDINLGDKSNLEKFVQIPEFKESGLSKANLTDLIKVHRNSFKDLQNSYLRNIPLKFNSKNTSDFDKYEMSGVELMPSISGKNIPNDINNIGWVATQNAVSQPIIRFTDFGKKNIAPFSKGKINYLTAFNSVQPDYNKIKYNDLNIYNPGLENLSIDTGKIVRASQTTRAYNYNTEANLTYASPSTYMKGRSNLSNNISSDIPQKTSNVMQTLKQRNTQPLAKPANKTTGMTKIQKNYENDKKMLARSQPINPLGSGGGGGTQGSNKKSGNVINEISDDIVGEVKRQIKDQIV